jgi:hypothetical protein
MQTMLYPGVRPASAYKTAYAGTAPRVQSQLASTVPMQPQVQFGGLGKLITKPLRWMAGKWNAFWNRRLEKSAIEQFQLKREELVEVKKKAQDQMVETEARARTAEADHKNKQAELERIKKQAIAAYKAAQEQQDENIKARLQQKAAELKGQLDRAAVSVETAGKIATQARQMADKTKMQHQAFEEQLKKADQMLLDAQHKVTEAERLEEAAKINEMVQEFTTDTVLKADDTARLMEQVNARLNKAQVKWETSQGTQVGADLAAEIEVEAAMKDYTQGQALDELAKLVQEEEAAKAAQATGGKPAAKPPASKPATGSTGDAALDNLLNEDNK